MMTEEMTVEEQEGVEAIQYLQSRVGIDESTADALRGWRGMSKRGQEFTLKMASSMKGKSTDDKEI